ARLSKAGNSSASDQDQPRPVASHATIVPKSNSHAEAPSAMATPENASVRPNALRARETSAVTRMRSALPASRPAWKVALPAAPSSRRSASTPGSGARAPSSCGASRDSAAVSPTRLLAAAGELGNDPAGGEGHAERGQRALADQLGGAVDQVAALVHQRVHLLAAGGAGLLQRGDAGQGAVGQFRLHLRLAQARFLARGAGRGLGGAAGLAGGLLDVAAGLAEVALDAVGCGG